MWRLPCASLCGDSNRRPALRAALHRRRITHSPNAHLTKQPGSAPRAQCATDQGIGQVICYNWQDRCGRVHQRGQPPSVRCSTPSGLLSDRCASAPKVSQTAVSTVGMLSLLFTATGLQTVLAMCCSHVDA